jgi:hypothetical protein
MSAPITEAHRELARNIMFYHTPKGSATAQGVRDAAQLIADSEARAVAEWQNSAHIKGEAIDSLLLECDRLRAEVINLTQSRDNWESACKANDACVVQFKSRAKRAEAELRQMGADKLRWAMLATDRGDQVQLAEAKLAAERARLDWLMAGGVVLIPNGSGFYSSSLYHPVSRDGIDAAMKEGK